MLEIFERTQVFKIDEVEIRKEHWIVLKEEKDAFLEEEVQDCGNTFDSLWNYMDRPYCAFNIPGNRWYRALWSKKRRIEFFTKTKTWVDDGTKREWSISLKDKPAKISMEKLLKLDSDKVIQYLSERNIKIGLDK